MNLAALIAWIITAGGGFYLLAVRLAGERAVAHAGPGTPAAVAAGRVTRAPRVTAIATARRVPRAAARKHSW